MRQLYLFFLLLFLKLPFYAQTHSLPSAWHGKWSGTVEIWSNNKMVDAFPMSLEIMPKDTGYTFILNYQHNPEKPDLRTYSLLAVNDSTGHYVIDEHNTILLDAYLNGDCMYDSFGGMGSNLLSRMCIEGDKLHYEITSVYDEPIAVTGDQVVGADTIPPIRSYQVYHVMRAVLSKP